MTAVNVGPGSQRILVINPNSSEVVTAAIDEAITPMRFPDGPVIDCVTLSEGPPGIESQRDADSVVQPLCTLIAKPETVADAFIIACFGDPGLQTARETTCKPVIGIAQAAYSAALLHGDRFGVIAILENSVPRHRRYIRQLGLSDRYAASVPIGASVTELEGAVIAPRMIEVGRRLINDHASDVVILGCAGMARHRTAVSEALGVPVIDPCQAAAAHAVSLLRLGH